MLVRSPSVFLCGFVSSQGTTGCSRSAWRSWELAGHSLSWEPPPLSYPRHVRPVTGCNCSGTGAYKQNCSKAVAPAAPKPITNCLFYRGIYQGTVRIR